MLNEVSPPGWGHTKAEKEKTKPNKPKSKIGGTAAAFKRALDDGRFKGLPGSTTKKEKTADMFKLMWAMKNKGDKPHYKPGTNKKYKKYQEEETSPMPNVSSKDRGAIKKRAKNLFKRDLTGEHDSVNEEIISEKDLSAKERRALPDKDFALPGKGEGPQGKQAGSYPIPDEKHARSALSLVAQHGTPEEKAKVRAKVKAKFPNIQQEGVLGSPGTKKLRSASDRSKNSMTDKDRKKQENIRKGRDILTDIQGTQKALDHEVSLDRRISRAKLKKEGYEDKALSNVIASIKKSGGVMASDIPKATDKQKAEWKAERARRVASRSKKSMADVVKSYRRAGESD